jgi:DNA-binding MarR family transcriptional regulator
MGISLVFSRAQAAFTEALHAGFKEAGVQRIVAPGMGPILFELDARDGRPLSELAAAARLPRSTMTGVTARLLKNGLVRTAKNPRDGRGTIMWLTPKGRSVIPRLRQIERRLDRVFVESLGRDAGRCNQFLERVLDGLVRYRTI